MAIDFAALEEGRPGLVSLDITPRSWGVEQRKEAVELADDRGCGVYMRVGNATTRFFADPSVPRGQIEVWMARTYKGQVEYATTLYHHDDFFDAFGFTWPEEDTDA